MTTTVAQNTTLAGAEAPAPGIPTFRREVVLCTLLDGSMADICVAGSTLLGIDREGRMLLRLAGRDRRYRGRFIILSDAAGWRMAWEVAGAALTAA